MFWIMDLEAATHKCISMDQLSDSEVYEKNGLNMIKGYIPWKNEEGIEIRVPITNVVIEPESEYNIIALTIIMDKGFQVKYKKNVCEIYRDEFLVIRGKRENNYYKVETTCETPGVVNDPIIPAEEEGDKLDGTIGENFESITCEPSNWNEVIQLSEDEQQLWKRAMKVEMECLKNNKVLEECQPDNQDKILGSRWTYSIKYNEEGRITKIRARLVALGCNQREGMDFGETYAPVVNPTTIRILLTMVASLEMEACHCDISSAFLYGEINERILMREPNSQPEPRKIFKLRKAIYGLKQAARCWYERINSSLTAMGYTNSQVDQCLYKKVRETEKSFILIHVDDILLVSNNSKEIQWSIRQLSREYSVKDLGAVHKYLGMYIERHLDNKTLYIHNIPMIQRISTIYGLNDCRPMHSPMAIDFISGQNHNQSPELPDNISYQKAIGSLLYVGLMTRPDIHLSINILSRKTSKPNQCDWEGIKRVIRYLNTTINCKLKLGGEQSLSMTTYSDADWGGDIPSRKSTSGQVHFLGKSLIEWKARKQNSVSLSTAEAEFIAAAEAVQTLCWLRELLKELGIEENLPYQIFNDNQSCLKMTESLKATKRSKHIDVKYNYIKDMVDQNVIKLAYCPSNSMIADIMTKPLGRSQHSELTIQLGVICDKSNEVINGDNLMGGC